LARDLKGPWDRNKKNSGGFKMKTISKLNKVLFILVLPMVSLACGDAHVDTVNVNVSPEAARAICDSEEMWEKGKKKACEALDDMMEKKLGRYLDEDGNLNVRTVAKDTTAGIIDAICEEIHEMGVSFRVGCAEVACEIACEMHATECMIKETCSNAWAVIADFCGGGSGGVNNDGGNCE
jgi:hypothetical protein